MCVTQLRVTTDLQSVGRIQATRAPCPPAYIRRAQSTAEAADAVASCIHDINSWLSANRLRLNPSKTQIIWLGSRQQRLKIAVDELTVQDTVMKVIVTTRDLGVVIDGQLTMSALVKKLCQTCYYQLRQLRPIARSLTVDTAKTLVESLVACRLTTASRCCTAFLKHHSDDCSRCRTPLHAW